MSRSLSQALMEYAWPGNVRELQNVIEQAVLVTDGPLLRLPDRLGSSLPEAPGRSPPVHGGNGAGSPPSGPGGHGLEGGGSPGGGGHPGAQTQHPPFPDAKAGHRAQRRLSQPWKAGVPRYIADAGTHDMTWPTKYRGGIGPLWRICSQNKIIQNKIIQHLAFGSWVYAPLALRLHWQGIADSREPRAQQVFNRISGPQRLAEPEGR